MSGERHALALKIGFLSGGADADADAPATPQAVGHARPCVTFIIVIQRFTFPKANQFEPYNKLVLSECCDSITKTATSPSDL